MGMGTLLTLSGMREYRSDLFDELVLPTVPDYHEMGVEASQVRTLWAINHDDFVDFLCLHTYGLCVAMPDADYMKAAIGVWSKAHLPEWQRMFETIFYKYNPLWNKDFTTHEIESIDKHLVDDENTSGDTNGDNTIRGYTHGYNDGTVIDHYDPQDPTKTITWTHSDKTDGTNTAHRSGERDLDRTEDNDRDLTRAEKGNIGVTMVQDMVEKERELAKYNIEEYIANEFKKQFMLMMW